MRYLAATIAILIFLVLLAVLGKLVPQMVHSFLQVMP